MSKTFRCLMLVLILSGCTQSEEDVVRTAYREQFLTASEPADPLTLSELKEQVKDAAPGAAQPEVVVIGWIYAGELAPWEPNKASFILSELPAEGHGEGHDADNCPFCKRRAAKAPTAIVKFVDKNNETIAIDARKLFDLQKGQTVIVQGKANMGEFDSLILTAEQMHIR